MNGFDWMWWVIRFYRSHAQIELVVIAPFYTYIYIYIGVKHRIGTRAPAMLAFLHMMTSPALVRVKKWQVKVSSFHKIHCGRNWRYTVCTGWLHRVIEQSAQFVKRLPESITAEFQTSTVINISTQSVRWELHSISFHDREALALANPRECFRLQLQQKEGLVTL